MQTKDQMVGYTQRPTAMHILKTDQQADMEKPP
jgi:hypothetical protein